MGKNSTLVIMGLFLLLTARLSGGDEPSAALVTDKIKAGYLYNFTKFITWPTSPKASFNICLSGEEAFVALLSPLEQRKVADFPIKIITLKPSSSAEQCQILIVDEAHALDSLTHLDAMLTVGDSTDFAKHGGMIGFVNKDSRIKLEINLPALKRSGLKISAKLLEVAEIVGEDSP